MANANVNKVVLGSSTLIDLTADTITADNVIEGYTFHAADGSTSEGSLTHLTNAEIDEITGGSGGSSVVVEELSVTANGTYTAPAGSAYSPVTVNVASPVKTVTGTFTGNGTRTIDVACDFEPDLIYVTSNPGTTASSGTVAFIIARDMMAATRYRNNSTSNSHYAMVDIVDMNTSGSSYSWRATYANSTVTLYCFSSNARGLLTSGRTYTYTFIKWT